MSDVSSSWFLYTCYILNDFTVACKLALVYFGVSNFGA